MTMGKPAINWRYIVVGYFALSVLALFDNVRGPLFPRLLSEFGLTNTEGALFFGLASASAILGSFLAGFLLSRWNLKQATLFGFLLMILGPTLIGYAANYSVTLVGAALWGVAFGLVSVVQNLWVKEGAPPALRRRLLSGLHSMYGAASVLAPVAASLSYTLGWSWRYLFIGIGILPIIALGFFPKGPVHTAASVPDAKLTNTSWKLTAFAAIVGFYVAAELLLTTRLSLYLIRVEDFTESPASLYLSYFFGALFLGRFLFTLIPLKTSSITVLLVSLSTSLGFIVLGLLGYETSFVVAAFFMAPFFPVAIDYIVTLFPTEASRVLSFIMGVSSVIVVIMHMLVGKITDLYGIQQAFVFDAALVGLAILGVTVFHFLVYRPALAKGELH